MTSGCAHLGRVWVCGRSAGRSDSCASREPPLQDWLDNWQLRGIPCGPISSRVCKPHLPPARFAGVWVLGLMRGMWHHQDRRRRGPRELTGIVDLTRGEDHPTARLLALVLGRSGTVHENWLAERGEQFRFGIQIATLDPFQGQQERHRRSTPRTQPASSMSSISSSSLAMPQVRCVAASSKTRPVTADARGDTLYQIRLLLRASRHKLTPRQQERLREAFTADEAHISVEVAYHCAQQVRDVFHQATPTQGRRLAAHLIQRLPACPIP